MNVIFSSRKIKFLLLYCVSLFCSPKTKNVCTYYRAREAKDGVELFNFFHFSFMCCLWVAVKML
jgi:hypothetical protein